MVAPRDDNAPNEPERDKFSRAEIRVLQMEIVDLLVTKGGAVAVDHFTHPATLDAVADLCVMKVARRISVTHVPGAPRPIRAVLLVDGINSYLEFLNVIRQEDEGGGEWARQTPGRR